MTKVTIQSRSGRTISTLELDSDASVKDLKKAFHQANKKYPPQRQRFTLPAPAGTSAAGVARGTPLTDDAKQLKQYSADEAIVLQFKDLGPQVPYAAVFFWEYFGPLALYPLFYLLPHVFYPGMKVPQPRLEVQTLALAYWSLHYLKRIAETFLVHRFGHATMPVANLFRNCSYYWAFAAFVSYFVNHPLYTPPPVLQSRVALALAVLCQLANLRCHIILANLRPPGDTSYKIPRGFLFNSITCANYTAEICGWLLFTVATQALPAGLFALAGAYQMVVWALQKHKRLCKVFDGKEGREKYPRRWVVLPPFL